MGNNAFIIFAPGAEANRLIIRGPLRTPCVIISLYVSTTAEDAENKSNQR